MAISLQNVNYEFDGIVQDTSVEMLITYYRCLDWIKTVKDISSGYLRKKNFVRAIY